MTFRSSSHKVSHLTDGKPHSLPGSPHSVDTVEQTRSHLLPSTLRTQIEMTMHAPVLVRQFTHLVRIPIALASLGGNYPRLSYLLCGQDRKIQQGRNTRHTDKGKHSGIRFRRKVKSPPSPSRVKLLALLSRSCLSLLLTNRQSRKLLASAGLYFRSCCWLIPHHNLLSIRQRNRHLLHTWMN